MVASTICSRSMHSIAFWMVFLQSSLALSDEAPRPWRKLSEHVLRAIRDLQLKGVEGSDCNQEQRETLLERLSRPSKKYYHFTKVAILTFTMVITFSVLPKFQVYRVLNLACFHSTETRN